MKYLVVGGAGYIGSHFVYKAIAQGHDCLVYDNLSTGHRSAIHENAQFQLGDLHDSDLLKKTIMDFQPDGIFHFAAFALVSESVADPSKYYHNNVNGVQTLLEVVRLAKKDARIIFSSTCAVFGLPATLPISEDDPKDPLSPYGRSKLTAEYLLEDYARAYGLKCAALRYFNACGAHPTGLIGENHDPETHLIPNVIKAAMGGDQLKIFGSDFPTEDGSCVRDYIHVLDLAEGHLLADDYLRKSRAATYDVFHLGTGKGYSNLQVVREIESVMGQAIKYEIADRRAGDPPALYSSIEKAKETLGFQAKLSDLKTIIQTALAWHQGPNQN